MFLTLDKPLFLLLWASVPIMWIMVYRSTMKNRSRRNVWIVGGIRILIILLLGFVLADPKIMIHSDQVNLFFCLDASASIIGDERTKAEAFIGRSVRHMDKQDRAGLIVFGKQPSMEVPLGENFRLEAVRSDVNENLTNISDALQTAIGQFPQKGKNRIVLLSDGNENLKNSVETANLAASLGIEIFPVALSSWFGRDEIFVKDVNTPQSVPLETPFQVAVEIMSAKDNQGEIVIFKDDALFSSQRIDVRPGNNIFHFTDRLSDPGLYMYRAVINFPDDGFFQNNEGMSYIRSTRRSPILYLSQGNGSPGPVARALTAQGLDLVEKDVKDFSGSLGEILEYNALILDNISGQSLSFATMDNMERYVKDLGGGLIMIGGDKGFGAGYYGNTPVEKALPVYMDVPTDLKFSELCIVFIVDKSSSMITEYSGKSKLEMAKIAAYSSIEMLNPTDNVGLIAFDSQFTWVVPIMRAKERQKIADNLSQVKEGGGTILFPALENAFQKLQQIKSRRKHIIVLSDGETDKADFKSLVESMSRAGISVSTVCIGSHSDTELMKSIARWGQGRYYFTDRPENIPNIFTGETKIVARKIIAETMLRPRIENASEILEGIDGQLPVLHGQDVTYPKPGADIAIQTREGPLLATWRYGLGRSAAFASDLSNRWGKDWLQWEHYGKFLSQMVKWTQRKETDRRYHARIEQRDERGTFTVDAFTEKNRFINNQDLRVKILYPSGTNRIMDLDQISPGRYRCDFPAEEIGNYYFTLFGETGDKSGTAYVFGFGIPYTEEFRVIRVNHSLLERIAAITGGRVLGLGDDPPDLFVTGPGEKGNEKSLWPFFTVAFLILLLLDVAARKVLD